MSGTGNLSDPRRTDTLCKLWGEGLSASAIAERMSGCTRNAVIGKIGRLRQDGNADILAADAKRGPRINRTEQVAEWMAEHGGRICDCARGIGLAPELTLKAWQRVCRDMGEQAR